jgi:hypothetical protein
VLAPENPRSVNAENAAPRTRSRRGRAELCIGAARDAVLIRFITPSCFGTEKYQYWQVVVPIGTVTA